MYMDIDLEYLCVHMRVYHCTYKNIPQAAQYYFFTEGKLSRAILLESIARVLQSGRGRAG